MLRKSKKQPETVAEKVSKLLAHPNDSESDDESDIDVATKARVADFEDEYDLPDARSTDFRKRNVKLLSEQSERYKGKISSRKELEEENNEEESDDEEEEEEVPYEESDTDEEEAEKLKAFNSKMKDATIATNRAKSEDDDSSMDYENGGEQKEDDDDDDEDDEEEEGSDGDDDDGEDDDDDGEESDSEENDSDNDAIDMNEIMSKTNQQAEIQKGLCVQNQLQIWERLLELRINTQKFTSKSNQLPPPETLQALSDNDEELQKVLKETRERSSKLLHQLLALQSALTQQHSELRQAVKRKLPTESSSESEPPSKCFASALQSNFENMRSYRNDVLLKWDDRTKLLTPGAGTKRKSMQDDYDVIKKIDSALANRSALIEKSQTLKGNQPQQQQKRQLEQEADQEDSELSNNNQRQTHIYDDSDFYHQQLRELIEYKASTTSSMGDITKQFVELQKLRQKMKKKVDTRASKGRKLRYVVHNKLINFMAPNEASDWTDESKTELFKSLFV
ncbi:hypothetical protein AWZ03_006338 [Drosophila navojoa]|uniref:Protein Aatf n=1 Tax=Drosophila navojoa TaxID=7232 RepID=A0A484BEC5_DRONA|nr:protein Aatf [Drosophila navojoa]TDG47207.1 hypothetical protein AWZ03_006338 [Drosophila navojoa]